MSNFKRCLELVNSQFERARVHILWITDENIIEEKSDASFFSFSINVLSTNNTTFSYLGYGEVPNWSLMNMELMKQNGNSYYANSDEEITRKIETDIGYFAIPAIENIQINLVLSKYIIQLPNFYPRSFYPEISGFYPSFTNNRPILNHYIGGMNYAESKRFIHYLRIPSMQNYIENSELDIRKNEYNLIGTIYVSFYEPMSRSWHYLEEDLNIIYKDSKEYESYMNPYVYRDTIIQNTPLIIQEITTLINQQNNYLAAIQLVQTQRNLLSEIKDNDEAIEEDLELLDSYYDLLINQAKILNLLQ